ncbi:THO complex subunit 4b [Phtheirospermum japonicum]|uniref:THO complex subunit 4b n=1 Tax=Phtheirospermum japonicum TaxID=374723 RepID=A0A830CML7_9LAMI|nr:THO complex subunit 4b [Phtheirospermum japonicum]
MDDMITMNKTSRSGPRPSGPGPTCRYSSSSTSRAAPYSSSAARGPESQLDHGMFAAGPTFPYRVSSIETGTKLLVPNLHFWVINEDIEELFSGIGELKSCSIHYDRSGRSEGTAEVVFCRRRDAESAIKRYNNV